MQDQQSASTFDRNSFTSKLCEKLLTFSENGQFSDICLIASDDVKFHAHKCVLSGFSDYFMAMFGGTLKEASSSEVKIHEINGKSLKHILTFLYTGHIDLQSATIENILRAANFFQLQPLIDECYKFMGNKMDVKNCLGLTMFADQHGMLELFNKTSNFASGVFERISDEKDFLKLDENQLIAIISSEGLCVSSEENVFLSIIKWIQYDKPNREKSALKLFSRIRYWLLSPDFIKQHRSKLPNQIEFLEMVCTWLEWHSSPSSSRAAKSMEFSKPKMPHGLLVVGHKKIQTYDVKLNIWTIESFPNLPSSFVKVIAHENMLIFSICHEPITCFDLQTHQVTKLPSLDVYWERDVNGLAMAVLSDELYVIRNMMRVVKIYNFSTGKWQNDNVMPMTTKFKSPKVAVAKGILYVVGNESNIMESYNPVTNEWTSRCIPKWEYSFELIELAGKLYKIGDDCNSSFNGVQSFDHLSNTWTHHKGQMKIPLHNMHCVSWNNRLFTVAGSDDTGTDLNLVQEYDLYCNKWKIISKLIEYSFYIDFGLVAFE